MVGVIMVSDIKDYMVIKLSGLVFVVGWYREVR